VEGNQNSSLPCTNADGRYVAFASTASNLVSLDTNAVDDIFFRDLQAGTITRISVSTSGAQANGASTHPWMSADGRYIVFESAATNLVTGKGQGVYLRDRQTPQTTFIGAGTAPVISADGKWIAFVSASALVPADTNGNSDVYVAERSTGVLSLVSVATDGSLGAADSGAGGIAINADGSVIAFQSVALNLDPSDTNTGGDIFVRDRTASATTRVSLGNDGSQADHGCSAPAISADGNLVAFESGATNLIAVDNNTSIDIFVRDRGAQTTTRVSLDSTGAELPNDSRHAVMSGDGRYVSFETDSPLAVPGKNNGLLDVLISDTVKGTITRVSVSDKGAELNGNSYQAALSQDGRYVSFLSEATNVISGKTAINQDVYARGSLVETPGLLAFTTQPGGASAGIAFSAQPVVEARNLDGSPKWDFNDPVTVAITVGAGRPGAVLSGTTTVNAVNAVATFAGLSLDKANTAYQLTATSGSFTPADSLPFDVAQTPTMVAITTQPAGASAGAVFATQPQIEVRDAENVLVASYTGDATVSIKSGTGRAGAVLSGVLTVPITGGAASFTGLSINLAGAGYVLTVSAGTLTPGDTAAFTVAQTPTKLAFSVQPGGASAGLAFTTQPAVQVLDAENNVVTSFAGPVALSIKSGTGRAGAILSGSATANAVAGVATFVGLAIDKANTGYVLSATSGTLSAADSAAFAVAQTPTKLVVAVQPSGASAGLAFSTQPVVQVKDAEDNLVPTFTGSVTLAIKAGTGRSGAVLSGATTLATINGAATFTDLSINLAGSGYVLTAASGALASADSSPFAVAQTPTKLAFSTQPAGASAGLAFTTQPAVQVLDVENNVVASFSGPVTLAIKVGAGFPGAALSGTTTMNATAGVAVFSGLSIDKASPGYALSAVSGTLASADSATFTVSQPAFVAADIAQALRWAGGLAAPTAYDVFTHDVVKAGASLGLIDVPDVVSISRKASGLEPNP
jgi:Tol biopolymer transport system component